MKRRTFLGSLAGLFGASRVAAESEPPIEFKAASGEPWTLKIDKMPGETDREFIERMICRQVLGRDPIGQAVLEARARRNIDEGELLTDGDVEQKMPGMRGRVEYGSGKVQMLEGTQPPATGVVKVGDRFGSFGRVVKINDDGTIDIAICGPVHPVGVSVREVPVHRAKPDVYKQFKV